MKKFLKITLGILTSIGGFLDVGAMRCNGSQAGGFQLIWAILLGTIV